MLLSPHLYLDRILLCSREYDPPLHRLLPQLVTEGMVCLDVGANIGTVALHLARLVGGRGHVHAFEPAPTVVDRLREHVLRNRLTDVITVHPLALGAEIGTSEFAFADVTTENQGMGSLVNRDNEVVSLQTRISVTTLDALVSDLHIARLDLIKVDIQGAEPLFLRGAKRTLLELKPALVMEISPEDLPHAGSNPPRLFRDLSELGYTEAYAVHSSGVRRLRSEEVRELSHFDNALFFHRDAARPHHLKNYA